MATRASLSSGFERVTSLRQNLGLIAVSLIAAAGPHTPAAAQEAAVPADPAASASLDEPDLVRGRRAYQRNCAVCHGPRGEGGLGPPMRGIGSRLSADEITRQLKTPRGVMPRLYPSPIDERLLVDLRAWLLQLP